MAACNYVITIKMAFWLRCYLTLLITFCRTFRVEPDPERLEKIMRAGMVADRKSVRAVLIGDSAK